VLDEKKAYELFNHYCAEDFEVEETWPLTFESV
jgi:hypothetical protein